MGWIRAMLLGVLALAAPGAGPSAGQGLEAPPGVESAVPDALAAEPGVPASPPTAPEDTGAEEAGASAAEGAAAAGEAAPAGAGAPEGAGPPAGASPEDPEAAGTRSPGPGAIERAWFEPAASLEDRIARVRRASFEYGVWSLDPAARALLAGGLAGTPAERERAAVRLAPDLPVAHIELARAVWLHGGSPLEALRAAWGAVLAIPRHPAASLWFAGAGVAMLAVALACGGLLCMALAGALASPHAAHDLGDRLGRSTPAFARAALLGALLLVPLALGEGLVGMGLVLLAIGCAYGARRQRVVLALAAAAVVAGAFPVARWAGSLLTAFERDGVAEAAYSVAAGSALASDDLRMAAAADSDLLAARGLALRARRARSLATADARYQELLAQEPDDWVIANNAANVRLELGHMREALDLYMRAAEQTNSAVVFYNLAQAHGRSIEVDVLASTLELAQSLDGKLLAELAQLQGADPRGFVVDVPLPTEWLWKRIDGPGSGEPLAAELRGDLAPGWLGRGAANLAAGAAGVVLLGSLLGSNMRRARWCSRCGRRQCARCDPESGARDVCGACTRLFYEPEETHKARRLERIEALRDRERRVDRLAAAVSLLMPGVAGFLARRPGLSLVACLSLSMAAAAVFWRHGPMPDPWLAGAAAPFLFLHLAALAGAIYAVCVGTALAARREL